ncbi:MAG: hypothetical protein VCE12_17550 [Candidatus Latescibacterota bacterium]
MRTLSTTAALVAILTGSVALAQDTLVGIWEYADEDEDGTYLTRLELAADGIARVTSSSIVRGEFFGDVEPNPFPDPVTISFAGAGTWSAEAGQLNLGLTESDLRVDGGPFGEAVDLLATALALSLAGELEIPDEDLPVFIATIQAALRQELDEEEMLDQVMPTMDSIPYELMGDELHLADGDGGTEVWTRVQATAVVSVNWADIKAGHPER